MQRGDRERREREEREKERREEERERERERDRERERERKRKREEAPLALRAARLHIVGYIGGCDLARVDVQGHREDGVALGTRVGVSNTHRGVSHTCVGVSYTLAGVSNTRTGVSSTDVDVSNTDVDVSNTYVGVLDTRIRGAPGRSRRPGASRRWGRPWQPPPPAKRDAISEENSFNSNTSWQ